MKIEFVLRGIPNERILNFPEHSLHSLIETLQDPELRYVHLEMDRRMLLINKDDIIKVEWEKNDASVVAAAGPRE